jgi:cell division protein FtsW
VCDVKTATTVLVFCVCALLALGMVVLYSASTVQSGPGTVQSGTGAVQSGASTVKSSPSYLGRQLVWGLFGILVGLAAARFPTRWLRDVRWIRWGLAGLAVFLLAIVLIPGIGKAAGGARRWLDFGPAQFQPSELAKVAVIVFLAWYGERFHRQMDGFRVGFLWPGLAVGLAMGLIFLEPDWGTACLIGAVAGGMLVVAGTKLRYLAAAGVLGAILLSVAIWHNDVRRERLLAFLNPEQYKETTGYQQWQAMLALGSGGLEGKGLGDGRQKLGFVPEHHTDFILTVVGEELGVVASLLVLASFTGILLAGLFIAHRARDVFSRLLAAGITLLISLQAAINIGVATSSLPNKGISLPFISYGGSGLVVMLGCVGLLLSVAREASWQPASKGQPTDGGELFFPQFS